MAVVGAAGDRMPGAWHSIVASKFPVFVVWVVDDREGLGFSFGEIGLKTFFFFFFSIFVAGVFGFPSLFSSAPPPQPTGAGKTFLCSVSSVVLATGLN